MSTESMIGGAMMMAQSSSMMKPHSASNQAEAQKVAKQFEGVLVSQMLSTMFEGISTDGPFGGGQGEAMFRSLMLDEYGKQISAKGGFGLSDSITKQLLAYQEG